MELICFHNPDEENGYLSNWYLSSFTIDDITFSSMEQYMMYKKAVEFNDSVIAKEILAEKDVAKIKMLGRRVSNYDETIWNGIRQIIVFKGLIAKFSQNKELKENLKSTGNITIAECSVSDCIWGIGLSMHDDNRFDKSKWKGKNLLGYTLMLVRDQL